ncbi:hypothetical protein F4808DRAFT_97224 [Astrocystis sublimbata]|nr:hypothetical protein F4808DRAFT_97224 [Astrocystis sublimbata]
MAQNDNSDVGLSDLIQFLSTPPPATNLMSIPDNFSGSISEDRWCKFKTRVFRRPSKKLQKRRRPPTILLPDSAVAARTTDGHRYIAISIPTTENSPLEQRGVVRHPVYDSVEAVFQRDVNSEFGMWKISPANRLVTVLNPVPEAHHESSISSGSPASNTCEQFGQATLIALPAIRKRAHTVSVPPGREKRYTIAKGKIPVRNRSISDPHSASSTTPHGRERTRHHASSAASSEKAGRQPVDQGLPIIIGPKDIETIESSGGRLPGNPVITLTLPTRKSSRRGMQQKPVPSETTMLTPAAATAETETVSRTNTIRQGSSSNTSANNSDGGNGHGNGISSGRLRGSFAASIETTGSSPQLLKATTAIVGQSVPVVVRPWSSDAPDSPLELEFPEPPLGKGMITDRSLRTSAVGVAPAPLSPKSASGPSRPERSAGKKQHDTEKLGKGAQGEHKGKGKQPATAASTSSSHPFGFLPGMPSVFSKMGASSTQRSHSHHGHHRQREGTSSTSPSLSSSPSESLFSTHESGGAGGQSQGISPAHSASASTSQRSQREEREARYISQALAEERETLENLTREELIWRYEALREQRIYERERRLQKLERSRDSWTRDVPMLLQNLNALLRQQQRILEGAGFMPTAGSSSHQHHHHQHQHQHPHLTRRRTRSVEMSSSSPLSDPELLDTQRSRSFHSSSESRGGYQSAKATTS